jgi:P-type Cu+ transporter
LHQAIPPKYKTGPKGFNAMTDKPFLPQIAKVEFPVTGMTCANCAMNIERTLTRKVPGIVKATVNFASERVFVEFDPMAASIDDMAAAIEKAGFKAIIVEDDSEDAEDIEQLARNAEIQNQTHKFIVGILFSLPLFLCSMARDFGLIGHWGDFQQRIPPLSDSDFSIH